MLPRDMAKARSLCDNDLTKVCERFENMRHRALTTLTRTAERVVGRPRLAMFARLLTNEVRLDTANDLGANGEAMVQRVARTADHPVVFDVGCHYGEWSESLLNQPGKVPVVHGFEPSRHSAERATRVLGARVAVHQIAFSENEGEGSLQIVHEGAGSNSLVPFSDGHYISREVEEVHLSTVDTFCRENAVSHITLLKIDAEGHDLSVIRGAAAMLSGRQIDMVQFEYNWRWIDARIFLLDAFELFSAHGYLLGKVTRRGVETYNNWHPELETFHEGNYLAFLPQWKSSLMTFAWWNE